MSYLAFGNDIDLVATVPEDAYLLFASHLSDWSEVEAYHFVGDRFAMAGKVLDWDVAAIESCCRGLPLDIFLLPVDWPTRQREVQGRFKHHQPAFTGRIAVDARRFNPGTGTFDPEPASIEGSAA